MNYEMSAALPVLARTPAVLEALLRDLPEDWVTGNEGDATWSAFDVVGHLIHGERTDWIPRVEHLLQHGDAVAFPKFDRFAQLETSRGRSLSELLDTFAALREANVRKLSALQLTATDLERAGLHPELGRVTLAQHLATWVAHDLDHLAQIARVMGRQYAEAVGPWRQYLRIIDD